MLFVFIPLALIFLGGIVYFAVSKKTDPKLRLAAIIALGAIALSVIVCLIIIFSGGSSVPPPPEPGDFLDPTPPPPQSLPWTIIIFTILLLVFLGVIIYLGLKEQKRGSKTV